MLDVIVPASGGADDIHPDAPAPLTPSTFRPLFVVRRRLQDLGVWEPLCAALATQPAKLMNLMSLDPPGMVDSTDPEVIAMIQAVGADPNEVLA